MSRMWAIYFVLSAVLVTWGLVGGHRPSITFGYPIMGAVVLSALQTRWVHRLLDKIPGGSTVRMTVVGVAAFALYWAWRAFAEAQGW